MKIELTIKSTAGLHASLASKIVHVSSSYDANVVIEYHNQVVDAKSILGLMSLAIPHGENVKLVASGKEAEKALKDLKKILG
jgi:phosphocarrier protein